MAAERIERIADLAKVLSTLSLEQKKQLVSIKDYYSKTAMAFINNKYEDALVLMKGGIMLERELCVSKAKAAKQKDILSYDNINSLIQIVRYSKEISMLVR